MKKSDKSSSAGTKVDSSTNVQVEQVCQPIAKPDVSSSAGMGEGYYRLNGTKRILYWDGEKWMKPVKDQQGRLGTWLGQLDKQPKVKSAEYIPNIDRVVG